MSREVGPGMVLKMAALLVAVIAPVSARGDTVVSWGDNFEGDFYVPEGLGEVVQVAAGNQFYVALRSDGTVVSWGSAYGFQPNDPVDLAGGTHIAAGVSHILAVKSDGTVVAWGYNGDGQCNVPVGLSGVTAVAGGYGHSLALKSDGTVVAWGRNTKGQCDVPVGLSGVTAVAGGYGHSLALKSDGTVVAWGENSDGQCSVPGRLSGVTAIAAAGNHSLALSSNGTVWAWGANFAGQRDVPVGLSGVTAIASGGGHNLALRNDGKVIAWGGSDESQCDVPEGLAGIVSIGAGDYCSIVIGANNEVTTWGNSPVTYKAVRRPKGLRGVASISGGHGGSLTATVALMEDGTVVAWGPNYAGQCDIPEGLTGIIKVLTPGMYSIALGADGIVHAWGSNYSGQCDVPPGLTDVIDIAAGEYCAALKSDGTVVTWGGNVSVPNVLKSPSTSHATAIYAGVFHTTVPRDGLPVISFGDVKQDIGQCVAPAGLTDVVKLYAKGWCNVALRANGYVVGWGSIYGEDANPPSSLNGNITDVSIGGRRIIALKEDGTIVAWGGGPAIEPEGLSNVVQVSAGNMQHSLALLGDGTVVGWGIDPNASVLMIPASLDNVSSVYAGGQSIALIKEMFGPYHIKRGYADTTPWMGWLYVYNAPWVWCVGTNCWYYISDACAEAGAGWIYSMDLSKLETYFMPPTNWGWSFKMSKWVYVQGGATSGQGWVYNP